MAYDRASAPAQSFAGFGARFVLTVLGAGALIVGAFMNWTASLAGTDLSLMADPYWQHLLGDVLHSGLSAAAATANELRPYLQSKPVRAARDNMTLPEAKQEKEDELQEQAINLLRGVIPWENADESQTIAEPWAAVLLAAGLVHAHCGSQGERRRFSRAGRQ